MLSIMLGLGAVTLTTVGIALKNIFLSMAAAGAWIIFGVQCYTLSGTPISGTWDIYYAIFFGSMFMAIATALGGFASRKKQTTQVTDREGNVLRENIVVTDEEEVDEETSHATAVYNDQMKKHREQYAQLKGNMRPRRKKHLPF